jgi:putative transposase
VGIDLGLKDSITTSDGFKSGRISFKKLDAKIGRFNQILSCRVKDGKNWFKTRTKLKNIYSKKKNHINDTIHKITTEIVDQYDKIFVGNVNSQLGLKNHRLAKTTSDAHWFEIKRQLEYKSEWYGKEFEVVDEKYTSKTCSVCGFVNDGLDLSIREWTCPTCNTNHDRDTNAAINIRTVGLTGLAFGKTNIS